MMNKYCDCSEPAAVSGSQRSTTWPFLPQSRASCRQARMQPNRRSRFGRPKRPISRHEATSHSDTDPSGFPVASAFHRVKRRRIRLNFRPPM